MRCGHQRFGEGLAVRLGREREQLFKLIGDQQQAAGVGQRGQRLIDRSGNGAIVSDLLRYGIDSFATFAEMAKARAAHLDKLIRQIQERIIADLNGAKSVAARHDLVAKGRYYCEYPRKEVKGARSGSFF